VACQIGSLRRTVARARGLLRHLGVSGSTPGLSQIFLAVSVWATPGSEKRSGSRVGQFAIVWMRLLPRSAA